MFLFYDVAIYILLISPWISLQYCLLDFM